VSTPIAASALCAPSIAVAARDLSVSNAEAGTASVDTDEAARADGCNDDDASDGISG